MTITWEALILFASAVITIATAVGILMKTRRDIMKSIEKFVCTSAERMVQPIVQSQTALLRHQIVRDYEYYSRIGTISLHALRSVDELYRAYHAMGGNGFIDQIMKGMSKLPVDATYHENGDHIEVK
jgi:hypothetical protein